MSFASWPSLPASPAALAAKVSKGELAVNVKDFGAKGDNSTDDTTAIQAAITYAGKGVAVYLPPGRYAYTALTLPGASVLQGAGFYADRDGVTTFGDAAYADTTKIVGTVLRCTATSGNSITHVDPTVHTGGGIRDLAIIGPGSGTTVGVKFGSAAPKAVIRPLYRNVMVCNFVTGLSLHHVNEGEFYAVSLRGCTKAASFVDDVNSNSWVGLNIQRCTQGVVMESGGTCYANTFVGFIGQNITSEGFVVRGFSHVWSAPYFELVGTGGNMMDFAGASNCHVISPQAQGAGTRTITVGATSNFNRFENVILSTANLTIVNNGTGSYITGNFGAGTTVTGSGGSSHYVDQNGAYHQAPSFLATSGSRPSIQNTNFLARNGTGGQTIRQGAGTPEGAVTAPVGSVYFRSDPTDANTVIYVKATGSGNTGWVAK